MTRILAALLTAVALIAVACAGPGGSAPGGSSGLPVPGSKVSVVTSTTVFADMVRQVGGDLVSVSSLVPANTDVHTFAPKPSDIRTLAGARLVVMNGLGLDDWLKKTIKTVANNAPVLQLGVDLPDATYQVGEDPNGPPNPHLWLDVAYAQEYAGRIASALAKADPTNASAYDARGTAYEAVLAALNTWVTQKIATIPAANRRFVSFHDAFPYYAVRYGLEIVGVAVEAPGQDPSAGYTAELIAAIRAAHVKAIFSEAQFPAKLVQQLANETGTSVVATLYDDSIGDPPISTYEAVIRWDTEQFVKALS